MNNITLPGPLLRFMYRITLRAKKLLRKKKCRAFNQDDKELNSITRIYVINLDRQPQRWKQVIDELSQILDAKGKSLKSYARRFSAVDALEFESMVETKNVDQIYTLGEQLFVDPRRVLPSNLNLDEEILMSRQEIAVALSHIEIWKKIAVGEDEYALILEDDIYFSYKFSIYVEKVWSELIELHGDSSLFDILYLSYKEVDEGAEKTLVTESVFQLFRGVWYFSGYVLSKRGAKKLLSQLPVKGPVDLWINHKFASIDALMATRSLIGQRIDEKSQNSYSVLPVLSKIGILNSEAPGIFKSMPLVKPLFVVGKDDEKLTSLAMALSMLGYRCCSDLDNLSDREKQIILKKDTGSSFDAFINVGFIDSHINKLAGLYPKSYLIVVDEKLSNEEISTLTKHWSDRSLVITSQVTSMWKPICEFLSLVPPASAYPKLQGLGQRRLEENNNNHQNHLTHTWLKADTSPWIIPRDNYSPSVSSKSSNPNSSKWVTVISDKFDEFDDTSWSRRDDTFPGNMALFSPANVMLIEGSPAEISVVSEDMGVRQFSSAALTTRSSFLFGRFEAVLKPPKINGIITGMFLHRDSPRQEIDIEFLGKDPCKLLINVYYNPGCDGSRFDYGYRGTPVLIDLGFDATLHFHSYAIEWDINELRWYVDGVLVHRRSNWEPTPIPHLPMKFHLNIWPSMSYELAGKIDMKLLPEKALVQSVIITTDEHEYEGIPTNKLDSESEELLEFERA